MSHYTIIGCGDIGLRVARELVAGGHRVAATVRRQEAAAELERAGIKPVIIDFDVAAELPPLDLAGQLVFYFMPPQGGGTRDARMLNFCHQLRSGNRPRKIVYISTSGVYGDCGGAQVSEETPVNPQTSRAKRRVDAEQQLTEQARQGGFELIILRVTGIYGPGRLPLAQLKKGHQVLRPEEAPPTNRIHSLDLVRICLAAMDRGEHGDIFNVCDGEQSSMSDYFNGVADLYGLPRPQQLSREEAEQVMNPLTLSFLRESRRMNPAKVLDKLAIELLYPTLKEGLQACRNEL